MKYQGGIKKAVIAVIAVAAIYGIIKVGVDSSETAECEKWRSQSAEFKGFYLTDWQQAQCESHGIHIESPVR